MTRPLLVVQGRADRVVPLAMSEAFAAKFPASSVVVPAATPRTGPTLDHARAMRWLARTAHYPAEG